MNLKRLLEIAEKEGANQAEVYYSSDKSTSFEIYQQQIDSFQSSYCQGYSIRALFDGKCGVSYGEEMSEEAFEACIKRCKESARINESEDVIELSSPQEVPEVKTFHPQLVDVDLKAFEKLMIEIESDILAKDPRINSVAACAFELSESSCQIINTLGVNLSRHSNYAAAIVECNAKDEQGVVDAYKVEIFFDPNKLDKDEFVAKITEEVLAKLSPKRMVSGKYPVILKNKVSSSLLGALSSMFSADDIQKDLSVLKGKQNQQVFASSISILDDPLMEDGYSSFGFDDEGVACRTKTLVENGVFVQPLHSRKTALKDHCEPTGNGFKSSYRSDIDVQPTNLYIQPHEKSYEEMVSSLQQGLIITEITGLHAGLNPLTTDFSLLASGFYVSEGKIQYPVNLITIAANYMEMMNDVEEVGNDLRFSTRGIGSPSLKIRSIAVSGE